MSVALNILGLEAIVASPAMERVLDRVERVARTDAAVLITGETGSGKELIARAVHHYSLRASQPWVDVNCGVLPEHLFESELFGYEKGAFSGATSSKAGFFELAARGTLFLDEIGDLDPRMQVKLLRVLDGAPYYRLGGTRKVVVDTRIVAATNQNLEDLVEAGKFREDLFHRLNQITIQVPPLRERPEDVVALALHFLGLQNARLVLSECACKALQAHHWPGNIRELRNTMLKAGLFADNAQIRAEDLALNRTSRPPSPPSPAADGNPDLNARERQTILEVLKQTNGHQKRAAQLLGISGRTLSRKLKSYGASGPLVLQEMPQAS